MTRPAFFAGLLLAWPLAFSCVETDKEDDTSEGDTDTDSDSDADGDADGDGDLDCEDPPSPSDIGGPDCVTADIACGEEIVDTTAGGSEVMDGEAYLSWYCTTSTSSEYTGPERVYAFEHPGTGNATITLETPCADLDLVAIFWESDDCPIAEYSILECDAKVGAGDAHTLTIWNNEPRRYLLVVDGVAGAEAPFRLSTSCE